MCDVYFLIIFYFELDEYLNHPIRRHYLVKNLPDDIRKLLLYRRKFAASTFDGVKKLCYMGLAQIGPKDKEYEQVFVYLNTKAILFDTRLSTPAYHQIGNL